jgi:hypothetical protein
MSPPDPRPTWIWPVRVPARTAAQIYRAVQGLGERLGAWPRWLLAGALVGALPLLPDVVFGVSFSHFLTAILLLPLLAAAVAHDAIGRGLGVVAAAFLAHSALTIALFAAASDRLATQFPPGAAYWTQTHDWLVTGVSPEYELGHWVPAHAQLLAAVLLFTYTSLGFVVFWQGLYEVDLMNGYVSQLLLHARDPWTVLALGWHPWSVCRGVGYLFLTFEVASLSLSRLTGVPLSTPARRRRRWLVGLGFLALDGVVKFFWLDPVRRALAANLL